MIKKIIVGQSGGPTAVINSSIAGVYKKAKELGVETVYGMVYGIEGFLKENIIDLDDYFKESENLELLKRTPSAFLGSCRFKLPKFEDDEVVYERIFAILDKYEIDALFYTGGNDSMDTIKMLADYAALKGKRQLFMGVPKTIDNDLPITDHCPGYGSAIKYVATSIKEVIRDNASFGINKPTVLIVEIMGRHAGWLTCGAALAKGDDCEGVDAIYLPEEDFDMDEFKNRVNNLVATKKSVVIAISEGIHDKDGKFICEYGDSNRAVDAFGHKQLSGSAVTLANIINKETGLKTRAIELSTLQRAATHIASLTDIEEAEGSGAAAVSAIFEGKTGMMATIMRQNNNPYQVSYEVYDIHNIANVEKKVPLEWIDSANKQMKQEYLDYARPLIMGELTPIFENGLPKHIVRK